MATVRKRSTGAAEGTSISRYVDTSTNTTKAN